MKIIAYTCLHYGSDYLAYAARSIIDHVDEWHILYAKEGSHGHRTNLPCPDTREQLLGIAMDVGGSKLRWWDGTWTNEGDQRMTVHQVAPDADIILVLDADEVWPDRLVRWALFRADAFQTTRVFRIPIIHYWRSFHRAVLHDPAYPVRVINPKINSGEMTWSIQQTNGEAINHFGYAQRPALVHYKQFTHGHKGEWRHDVDWYHDRFLANAQRDCHPVGSEWWNPETVNPLDYMPAFMQEHPFFNLEVIE